MKDQYVGDLSDFAKYALLRRLAGTVREKSFRVGVVWYLIASDGRGDGRHVDYLSLPRPNPYAVADPYLYGRLRRVVHRLGRELRHVEGAGVLPPRTARYAEPLTFGAVPPPRPADRLRLRDAWLEGALRSTARCDLVLLDPDNGLAPPGARRHAAAGLRHAFPEELRPFAGRG